MRIVWQEQRCRAAQIENEATPCLISGDLAGLRARDFGTSFQRCRPAVMWCKYRLPFRLTDVSPGVDADRKQVDCSTSLLETSSCSQRSNTTCLCLDTNFLQSVHQCVQAGCQPLDALGKFYLS